MRGSIFSALLVYCIYQTTSDKLEDYCIKAVSYILKSENITTQSKVYVSLVFPYAVNEEFFIDKDKSEFNFIESNFSKRNPVNLDDYRVIQSLGYEAYDFFNDSGKVFVFYGVAFTESKNRKIFVFNYGFQDLEKGTLPMLTQKMVVALQVSVDGQVKELYRATSMP